MKSHERRQFAFTLARCYFFEASTALIVRDEMLRVMKTQMRSRWEIFVETKKRQEKLDTGERDETEEQIE